MQTEVPTLPVVHLNVHKNVNRKQNLDLRSSAVESKTCSPCKNVACISSNKKCLHPLLGGPYRSNIQQPPASEGSKFARSSIGQRVLSAKMLRVKELQNQLADAHYHLNELANENRLLKALQKRQDSALKRYEGTNAELPKIINSHHEELRVLQIKYKKLKATHKETCDLLKEKETELQCLQSQNKHLLQLSKDRNLGEREKLQVQVSDLNHRIQQQQDTIQALHRKLALESKSLKHQLHVEITKRKETQKHLDETAEKLRTLENLLANRERRLYCNGQLSACNKNERLGTQSLTNLREISPSNPLKLSAGYKRWQKDIQKGTLPVLNTSESNDNETDNKTNCKIGSNQISDSAKSETMANLQQIRKYRLQKTSHTRKSSLSDDLVQDSKEFHSKINDDSKIITYSEKGEYFNGIQTESISSDCELESSQLRKLFENRQYKDFNELSNACRTELNYSSEGAESENDNTSLNYNYSLNMTKNSRQLHASLTSSADEASDTTEDLLRKKDVQYNEEENFKKLLAQKLLSTMYTDKLKVSGQYKEKDASKNDSEPDYEISTELNEDYSLKGHRNDIGSHMERYYEFNDEVKRSGDLNSCPISRKTNCNFVHESKAYQNVSNSMQKKHDHLLGAKYLDNFQPTIENDNYGLEIEDGAGSLKQNIEYDQSGLTLQVNNKYITSPNLNEDICTHDDFDKEEGYSTIINENEFNDETALESAGSSTNESKVLHKSESSVTNVSNESEKLDEKEILDEVQNNEQVTTNVNLIDYDITTRNKLNKQDMSSAKMELCRSEGNDCASATNNNEINNTTKLAKYNKDKLLEKMKAIDNNENIEFLNQDYSRQNVINRRQITENLFRGLPTQTRSKQDIIKDIFEADTIGNKARSSCSKLH